MPPPHDPSRPPPHPVRESVGFVSAALAALGRLFWPAHRRTDSGEQEIVGEAETVHLPLDERIERVAPYPAHD